MRSNNRTRNYTIIVSYRQIEERARMIVVGPQLQNQLVNITIRLAYPLGRRKTAIHRYSEGYQTLLFTTYNGEGYQKKEPRDTSGSM